MHPCFCERHLSPAVPFLPAGTDASPAVYAPIKIHPDKQKHLFLHGMQRKGCKSTYSHGHAGTGTARYVHLRHFPVRSYDQQFSAKYLMVRRHDLDLVGVVVATLVFRTLFVVVPNFETTVTVPQRTVVVPNTACSYHYYTTFQRRFQVFPVSFFAGIFMRVITYILIYQSSESLGPRGLRRGVCPAQVLSSVRDLAALRDDLGMDFMGVSKYQMAV